LARRATIIRDLKKEGKALLTFDAGNSLFTGRGSPSSKDREKARLIAMAYRRMGYQAVNLGSYDLAAGIEFLKDLQKETLVPFLSANLLEKEGGQPVFKSHVVLDAEGMRVGLLGLTSDAQQNRGVTPEGYFVSDPLSAAKRLAAELGKDCDIIVALSNFNSFEEYTKLVQQVKEIHLIFGSGGRGYSHQTLWSDGGWQALLFHLYPKGQYLGRIDLKVVQGGRNFVDLSRKVQLEKQITSIERQLESYRKGTGRAKSIPQHKREEYIVRLEDFKKRTDAQLEALERESRRKSTFLNTTIRLDDKVRDDPEIKELVGRFKMGS
jgi:2',3'-cyclic-nucleotide 2'-phosphodiesterase (5'-nucleotidase family)